MSVSQDDLAPVLTSDGRRQLSERLARAGAELERLDRTIRAGEAGPEELAARQRLGQQMRELERVLDEADDVIGVTEDPAIVEVGDGVEIEGPDGAIETYAVVHAAEADAAENKISAASPLGSALLGARPGETVTVDAPGGRYVCRLRARWRLG